jgi:hypothetical protein
MIEVHACCLSQHTALLPANLSGGYQIQLVANPLSLYAMVLPLSHTQRLNLPHPNNKGSIIAHIAAEVGMRV